MTADVLPPRVTNCGEQAAFGPRHACTSVSSGSVSAGSLMSIQHPTEQYGESMKITLPQDTQRRTSSTVTAHPPFWTAVRQPY